MAAIFNVLRIERLHLHVNALLSLYIGLPVILDCWQRQLDPQCVPKTSLKYETGQRQNRDHSSFYSSSSCKKVCSTITQTIRCVRMFYTDQVVQSPPFSPEDTQSPPSSRRDSQSPVRVPSSIDNDRRSRDERSCDE